MKIILRHSKEDIIYHSKPYCFNDPYDCLVYINKDLVINDINKLLTIEGILYHKNMLTSENISQNYLGKVNRDDKRIKELQEQMKKRNPRQIKKILNSELAKKFKSFLVDNFDKIKDYTELYYQSNCYVACFSENVDSMLMWSHYSQNHTGFVLEYDMTEYADNKKMFNPVIYDRGRFDATIYAGNELAKLASKEFNIDMLGITNDIIDYLFSLKANSFKSNEWEYENEWRSVIYDYGNTSNIAFQKANINLFRIKNGRKKQNGAY